MIHKFNLDDFYQPGNERLLFEHLNNMHMDVFPADFKIEITHLSDIYTSDQPLGEKIKQLQQVITKLDIPHFFVWVISTNNKIANELDLAKTLYAPTETDPINSKVTSGKFNTIKNNASADTFCVLPWIHYYINPQGLVGSCCNFDELFPYGNLHEESLQDIIQGKNFKDLRKNMLAGVKVSACKGCWSREEKGIKSARQRANSKASKEFIEQVKRDTQLDGTYENFKLQKLDFRASNICNLMCRMCSGKFSSKIAHEESTFFNDKKYYNANLSKEKINEIFKHIEENIDTLDYVYFAGGEPLVTEEHYKILDLLIQHNKTDIQINYNTNFSILKYKKFNILDYWRKFKNISVAASIDLYGEHSDYFRHGVEYDILEKNYHTLTESMPHVNFSIQSTLHAMNISSLIKLQQHWIKNLNFNPINLSFSILVFPNFLQISVLPKNLKEQFQKDIHKHICWLEEYINTQHLVKEWKTSLNVISQDFTHLQKQFVENTLSRDRIRKQNVLTYYPEFRDLIEKYAQD